MKNIDWKNIDWDNKEQVIELLKLDGKLIPNVSERLRGDKEVILAALHKNNSEELWENYEEEKLSDEAIANGFYVRDPSIHEQEEKEGIIILAYSSILEYASAELKEDKELVKKAILEISEYGNEYYNAGKEAKKDIEIVKIALSKLIEETKQCDLVYFEEFFESLGNDSNKAIEFIKTVEKNKVMLELWPGRTDEYIKQILEQFDDKLFMEEDFLIYMLQNHPEIISEHIPTQMYDNNEFLQKALEFGGISILRRKEFLEPENKDTFLNIIDNIQDQDILYSLTDELEDMLEYGEEVDPDIVDKIVQRQLEVVPEEYLNQEEMSEEEERKIKEKDEQIKREKEFRKIEENYFQGEGGIAIEYITHIPSQIADGISPKKSDIQDVANEMIQGQTKVIDNDIDNNHEENDDK